MMDGDATDHDNVIDDNTAHGSMCVPPNASIYLCCRFSENTYNMNHPGEGEVFVWKDNGGFRVGEQG